MRRVWVGLLIVAGLAVIVGVLHHKFEHLGRLGRLGRLGMTEGPLAHARSEFTFMVQAPMAVAFPLFGPEGERGWAGPHWDPEFAYPNPASAPGPQPAKDVEGAVFRIRHAHHVATWVNTVFDAQAGHAAYVYVIEGRLATRIDVQLSSVDSATTRVRVMYERTALSPSMNPDVVEMSQRDAKMGPEWESDIGKYLKARVGH
jgi:hypothetical protein